MEKILQQIRVAGERTRLRVLALAASCDLCVADFSEVLGQSQPRVSRHLGLMVEAGLLERHREAKNVFFRLAQTGLAQELATRIPADDETVVADRRAAQRVMAERARAATELFRQRGSNWDEMAALGLPHEAIELAVLGRLPGRIGRLLDIGTGTGRMLQVIGERAEAMLGIDASPAMLALARTRLAEQPGLRHAAVRRGDMYRLGLPDGCFDVVLMQMVLHYATHPARALEEAVRVLAPGGTLIVVDLAPHERRGLLAEGHHWLGFSEEGMRALWPGDEVEVGPPEVVGGELETRIWVARRRAAAGAAARDAVMAGDLMGRDEMVAVETGLARAGTAEVVRGGAGRGGEAIETGTVGPVGPERGGGAIEMGRGEMGRGEVVVGDGMGRDAVVVEDGAGLGGDAAGEVG